ncbi:lysylphosphatidylglycerol synthase domain-containing protein [Psychrobacter phenylpyruvicus]|uniref:Inner membrane protein ybhN n=1 Tax=Psychrobacter phenylpyruvicus TaxID=29432 RepID=A0A379LGV6_9GAMM|nr:lysylphosphatidylglycerol synthase domain-containing protein [Psychrobacter phenylpyruvicus]SUD89768.1 Inner membrane protein ybhN [Psychrobacter phenylpyruvicus]
MSINLLKKFLNPKVVLVRGTLFLLALFIFLLAIKTLYTITHTIKLSDVLAAIDQIPNVDIFLALLVVAFGYLVLTLYDKIALKHMHIDLPFKKVAFTSFTAYAIGHTIGLAILSASGVRFRMYGVNKVKAENIANVVWLVSMAFTFGITTLVALSLTLHPEATVTMMGQLDMQLSELSIDIPNLLHSASVIRGLGISLLAIVVGLLVWSGRQGRHIQIRGWRFDLPPAAMIIKQIIISIIDLASVAFVLYLLLPHDAGIGYFTVFSAFVQSMILAILSHVPGGLGVFELTMMASLPTVDKTYLLAVLLVFRLLYYLLPFFLALVFFFGHEIWLRWLRKP